MVAQFQKTVCEHSIRVISKRIDSVQVWGMDLKTKMEFPTLIHLIL